MAHRFVNISAEEIVAINEAAFFIHLCPSGSIKSGGHIPRRFASRYISTTIHLPFGG